MLEDQIRIKDLIQQETGFTRRLLEALHSENQALCSNDFATVEQLTPLKQQIIEALSTLEQQRESLLRQAGFSNDKSGMTKFITQCDENIEQDWQILLDIVSECNRQNEINGIMINTASRQTSSALSILKGQLPGENIHYGSKGEALPNTTSNPLAKA